jgi:threonine dehydratase
LAQIRDAILTSHVYDIVQETPLAAADHLSDQLGNRVLFKREDLHPLFSFKIRGTYNRMAEFYRVGCRDGVITASAGNHAQGVAYSAKHLGITAVIVMPCTTPDIKVDAVRRLGADVLLRGDDFAETSARAYDVALTSGRVFVEAFDDPFVIAGQDTIGEEILRQSLGRLDAVFVPVGGGGLISGIAAFLHSLAPHVTVGGVQPFEADAMYQSLAKGHRVALDRVGRFADGVAVREAGRLTFPIVQQTVDRIVRVSNDEICGAIKDVFDDTRTIMEPAGALSVAGLRRFVESENVKGANLVAVLSGANMDFHKLGRVAERIRGAAGSG